MGKLLMILAAWAVIWPQLPASTYEKLPVFDRKLPINQILLKTWEQNGLSVPRPASDVVFLRRLMLTAAGRLPTAAEVQDFLDDETANKHAAWVERVLDSPEYADMQAMRFADMLRIKSEFPINLWPNAVQFYHRKVHDDILSDRSLKDMFYEMLTVSGSNFRTAYANFFRASADRSPAGLAKMVLLTTMNMRESALPEDVFNDFANLFKCIRYKSTYEWKEEIVYNDYIPTVFTAALPDGTCLTVDTARQDPRRIFADWLLDDRNPYFARAFVNRVWHWVFGRGISPQADQLELIKVPSFWDKLLGRTVNGSNEPFSAELQEYLMMEFKQHNYSLKHLYRIILNSMAFQASSLQQDENLLRFHAAYPVRRLESEVLIDALGGITRSYDRYMSVIPEPFTYLPVNSKAVNIADGSISSGVLDSFGRPPRDSGQMSERNTASSDSQNLYLMNSATLYRRITGYSRELQRRYRDDNSRLDRLYLDILSRRPTAKERKAFHEYQQSLDKKVRNMAWSDTIWVLFNSKEFLFYH